MRSPILGRLTLLFVIIFAAGCREDDDNLRVPRVETNIQINLNLPQYQALLSPGGWVYQTGGSRGIIVYRVNIDEFAAFDRHCPFNVPDACQVEVDEESGITAIDNSCCGSTFEIITGNVVEGPAEIGLSRFNTQFNSNTNLLRITN